MDPIVLLFFATALLALTGAFTAALMFSARGMPPKPRYRRSPTQ